MTDLSIASSYSTHFQHSYSAAIAFLGGETAISANGSTITTSGGRKIIDLASGGFGYTHPYVLEQAIKQLEILPLSGRVFFNRALAAFTRKLAHTLPGSLEVSYPCNSPAEAVEGALKLALGFHKKRSKIISTNNSWHGATMGALAVSGREKPLLSLRNQKLHIHFVPYDNAEAFRQAIDKETAAVILEPVRTREGIVVPSPGFLKSVRQFCNETGTLLIFDETSTGLGNCGKVSAGIYAEVIPDIMVLGNTLGGGILPGGAYVTTQQINSKVYGKAHPALHGSTTGGNPIMCSAGLAALEVIEREELAQKALFKEKIVRSAFGEFQANAEGTIQSAYVCGLHSSLTLAAGELSGAAGVAEIRRECLRNGFLINISIVNDQITFVLNPPLIISNEELSLGLAGLESVLSKICKGGLSGISLKSAANF